MNKPYISLGMMLGDAHVGVLERCLRSVLDRTTGSIADEIVIGFNGTNFIALDRVFSALMYRRNDDGVLTRAHAASPAIKLVVFEWPGRFDAARNLVWQHLTGEWCLWLDADDIVADPATKEGLAAIEAVERDYGIAPPSAADLEKPAPLLRDWLKQLPNAVNVIFAPYNYTLQPGTDYVTRRQKMKRMVRRSAGHIWYSPQQSGVHEYLHPLGAHAEVGADLFGFLVQHFPSEDEVERSKRNALIVNKLSGDGPPTEARHAYDLANAQFSAGDVESAVKSARAAIQSAQSDMDQYSYRLALCTLRFAQGLPEAALQEAWSAVTTLPKLRDAYFVAVEALFRMGKWEACIEWYERGVTKPTTLMAVDQPLMAFVQPRAQASWAYLQLGQPAKAHELAKEALDRYPKDSLALQVFKDAEEADRLHRLHKAVLDVVELALPTTRELADDIIVSIGDHADTRGLTKGLRFRTLAARLNAGQGTQRTDLEDELRLHKRMGELPDGRKVLGAPINFYSPHAVKPWSAADLDGEGMGGSESSVAYLARELSKLGRDVTVFTPKTGGVKVWGGIHREEQYAVIQRDLLDFDPEDLTTLVTCRAPYLVREMGLKGRVFCWHQDNGYLNPWFWNPELAAMHTGHLHVSQWARKGLLEELTKQQETPAPLGSPHYVLGNGIALEAAEWLLDSGDDDREPKKVVYASDPTRGLEQLLKVWPDVLVKHPDAQLNVMCGFMVMLALKQDAPGLPVYKRLQEMQRLLSVTKNVNYLGWVAQSEVLAQLRTASISCYPGGPMAEGFGVSLVQAQASGCTVLMNESNNGALPEVLGENVAFFSRGNDASLVDSLDQLLKNSNAPKLRRDAATDMIQRHSWPVVARRFLELTEKK